MKQAFVLVLCCCALAAGCAEKSNAPAATVNGVTVTTRDVVEELDAISASPDYLKNIDNQFKQAGEAVVGSAPGTYDAAFVAEVIRRQMQFALVHSEVERRNLNANDECKVAAKNDLILSLGQNDAQTGEATLAGFPEGYRNRLQGWYEDEFVLQSDLVGQPCGSAAVAKAYFDAHPQDFTQNCVSLISVDDENTANSIVSQARAGGDFAALATQFSTDQQTASAGGDAGCHFPLQFPTTIAPTVQATQVGAVTDPISNNVGGFVIIKVTDRKPAAFSDVSSQAEQLAARDQSVEFNSWLQHAQTDSRVTVDPRYGTFDQSTFSIKPPNVSSTASSSGPEIPTGSEAPPTPGP